MKTSALITALLLPAALTAADYTTCYHVIPKNGVATIQADLDCTAVPDVVSFVLENGARLELNGHSLAGNASSGGVVCRGRCEVVGPGAISGYGRAIYGERGAVEVSDLLLTDNEESIDVVGRLTASRIDAQSTRYGVRASRTIRVSEVSVRNTGGDGILGRKIVGSDVTIADSHTAIASNGRVRLTRLTATGNQTGVVARGMALTDSVVTSLSYDILSVARPLLVNTACGTSAGRVRVPGGFDIGPTWGVCAND